MHQVPKTADSVDIDALATRILAHAPADGVFDTPWPGLAVFRASEPRPRQPAVYDPCLCIVAQGRKQAFLEGETFTYDPLHSLALSVPLPIESQIVLASPEAPFLSLKLAVDPAEVTDLVAELPENRSQDTTIRGIDASPLDPAVLATVVRLFDAIEDPGERRVVAPLVQRELLYRLLVSPQGHLLRAVAHHDGRSERISRAIRFLRANYTEAVDVASIADEACMSPSALFASFKEMTSVTPIQYLKRIRLHEARRLLVAHRTTVTQAATLVGYSSPSQFSREFKRFFGTPPSHASDSP